MARLIYSAITSLDGYTADRNGSFDWATPDEEVHAFVNELERPIGTHLYGRRMYEVMSVWETIDVGPASSSVIGDFADIWRRADKVVYTATLGTTTTARTRIERSFEPEAVQALKDSATHDLTVGGPGLAGTAIRAGLVDEFHLLVAPIVVGGGTRWLPDGVRLPLELRDQHRFRSGMAHLHYDTASRR